MSEWSSKPLERYSLPEANSFVDGPFGSDLKVSDYTDSGIRILQLQNLGDGFFIDTNVKYTSESKAISLGRCIVKPGDLIIAKMAEPLARACIVPPHIDLAIIVADLIKLRPAEDVDPDFLCAAINFAKFRREAERLSTGTTRTRISLSTLKRIGLLAPKEAEQKKLGEIIRTFDQAIEQTEALIAKSQQVKAGLMHDLFTRGVTKDGKLRPLREEAPHLYKESPLGWIPKAWEVDSIGNQFSIQLGKMLNKLAKTGRLSAPYVGNRAVQWDKVDLAGLEEMDFTPSEREKFRLHPGDLLVCEGGEVGRTAMWRGEIDECYYQKALHRLRPLTSRISNEYMLRFMRFACDSGMFRFFTSQSSIAHLTQEKLSAVNVILPRMGEQEQIATLFETVDEDIEREQTALLKQLQIKQGLMHDLLTGRVRVPTASTTPSSAHV